MKNLKNNLSKMILMLSVLLVFSSCKKDKDDEGSPASAGSFTYQSKTTAIAIGDYRSGNGDGAWIYFTGDNNVDFVQVRFSQLGDYVIPIGTFTLKSARDINPYDAGKNFKGGQVIINNVSDELNGGTVIISKNGETYTLKINATTLKGTLTTTFEGTLKKI